MLGDVISSAVSYISNRNEAEKNRNFQAKMSDTAYQRAVDDLNAAGLSPMLAYSKGGASTPGGATAAPMQPLKLGETEQRTTSSDLSKAQVDVAKSQEQVNIQTAKQVAAQAAKTALEVEQMPTRFYYDLANLGSQINSNSANAIQTGALSDLTKLGKAPAADTNIVRNIKDATSYGKGAFIDAKSVLDDIISRSYKSIRGIK
jgi:hypothetical protein